MTGIAKFPSGGQDKDAEEHMLHAAVDCAKADMRAKDALLAAVQAAVEQPAPPPTADPVGMRPPTGALPQRSHPQQHTPAIDSLATAHGHPLGRLAAATAVIREREGVYGSPREGMRLAADLASLKLSRTITARDVAVVLGCVKEARLAVTPGHRDSATDLVGYAAIAASLQDDG